jgi:pSer/pThr/pTyr-binding forkhead associated (FHA) protein
MARMILSLNGRVLAEYNLSRERCTIGRLPDNDIRIDNPAVSGHHSLVISILNDCFLEDLNSTNGTYVNGKLIKKHALAHGDVVTIGQHQLRFIDSDLEHGNEAPEKTLVLNRDDIPITGIGDAPPRETPHVSTSVLQGAAARLQILSGAFAGRELELTKPITTLGRTGRQVVAITRRGTVYSLAVVEPGQPERPPRVNGEPAGSRVVRLNDNDVIEVAGVKMAFFLG